MADTPNDGGPPLAPGRLGAFAAWLEGRAGLVSASRRLFDPVLPTSAGSRLRRALGVALFGLLLVEGATGLLLLTGFSPSAGSAWGSTFYIDRVLTAGWFVRGLHHAASHALIVAGGAYILVAILTGAYRAPREVLWWLTLGLFGLVLVFAVTGNALVWDQDGYWAWHVETGILGSTPVAGPYLQRVVLGGYDLGNAAVGRLNALHVGLLPAALVALLAAAFALGRRHALAPGDDGAAVLAERAWPGQTFWNLLATFLLVGAVGGFALAAGGAPLEAPADPAGYYPARPGWFFLWLFELRKPFPGRLEVVATMIIPGALATVLALLPWLDRVLPRRVARVSAGLFAVSVLVWAGYLTAKARQADRDDPHYREAMAAADVARDRAVALALNGIPPEGDSALLNRDPVFHGHAVLEAKCLSCHVYGGKGIDAQRAPDLKGFGTRPWVRGLLDDPGSPIYYGKVPGCDGMVEWKKSSKLNPRQLDEVADLMVKLAGIDPDLTPEEWLSDPAIEAHPGRRPFENECGKCHAIPGWTEGGQRDAPGLFGWGSPRWTARLIRKPGAPDLYGYLDKGQQMPPFAGQLTANDFETLIRYLKNDLGTPVPPHNP